MQQLSTIVLYKTKELPRDYVNPLSYDIDSRSSSGFKYNEGKLYSRQSAILYCDCRN